jgi:hypothetical protein
MPHRQIAAQISQPMTNWAVGIAQQPGVSASA